MARTKKVPFFDALAIWAETADEQEIRDGVNQLATWAAARRFQFRIHVKQIEQTKALPLLDQGGK